MACGVGLITIISLQSKDPAKKTAPQWYLLAAISIVLSIDEVARIHEVAGGTTVKLLFGRLEGLLHYGWVIAGIAFVGVVGTVCVPFLWSLPAATRRRFIIAGVVFLSGTVGCEMIAASIDEREGMSPLYRAVTLLEETLEFSGVGLFLVAIHQYIEQHLGSIELRSDGSVARP